MSACLSACWPNAYKQRYSLHLGHPFCISGSQPCMSASQFPFGAICRDQDCWPVPSTLQLQPCPEHHRSKQKTQHGKAALAKSLQVLCFLHFVNCYACMHSRGVTACSCQFTFHSGAQRLTYDAISTPLNPPRPPCIGRLAGPHQDPA